MVSRLRETTTHLKFVVGKQSIKVDEAIAFLKANAKNGWVNLDIKQAKGGNYYCELDTWEANQRQHRQQQLLQILQVGKTYHSKVSLKTQSVFIMREGDLVPSLFLSSNVNCQKNIPLYLFIYYYFYFLYTSQRKNQHNQHYH